MRFPAPTCNAENSLVETSNSSSSNPPWSPLQNSWVTNGDSETTCYDQVRHFFAAKFQSNAFTAIWGKEYFVLIAKFRLFCYCLHAKFRLSF